VIASDPPDSAVYIQPGIAVDAQGQTIVVTEPISYDVGRGVEGLLYLLLSYGEGRPRAEAGQAEGPLYVEAGFGVEALPNWPDGPYVELARVRRQNREAVVRNASDHDHPALDEIDLRFRIEAGVQQRTAVSMAVSYAAPGDRQEAHWQGAKQLARAYTLTHPARRLNMDDAVPLTSGLAAYTLVYLVGQNAFQLTRPHMEALYSYIQGGGTVLIESCRRDAASGNPAADESFTSLLADLGVKLAELPQGHPLLTEPFLFGAPPPGFETEGAPAVMVADGVILSTCDYGCLWQGDRRNGAATREAIRTAHEWGSNIVAYAIARREQTHGR
ncbi:MAG: DUF4159 domain-containing protein, partial [Anaerolineales bacterium]|nr:DUF4159 domain-containing protein [Anaerolineales bacterium]